MGMVWGWRSHGEDKVEEPGTRSGGMGSKWASGPERVWGSGPMKSVGGWGGRVGPAGLGRGQRGGGRKGPGRPSACLQPGGDLEWKVERENISARSAIFSGERPADTAGGARASAPRALRRSRPPVLSPPRATLVTRPATPRRQHTSTPGHRGGAGGQGDRGRAGREAGRGRAEGRGGWLEEARWFD